MGNKVTVQPPEVWRTRPWGSLFNFEKLLQMAELSRNKMILLVALAFLCALPLPAPAKDITKGHTRDRVKETITFIPAREMNAIIDMEREGIFVPYHEYRTLYEKAKRGYPRRESRGPTPPHGSGPSIIQANYSGTIAGEILQFGACSKSYKTKRDHPFFIFHSKAFSTRAPGSTGTRRRSIRRAVIHASLSPERAPMILPSNSSSPFDSRTNRPWFPLISLLPWSGR